MAWKAYEIVLRRMTITQCNSRIGRSLLVADAYLDIRVKDGADNKARLLQLAIKIEKREIPSIWRSSNAHVTAP